MVNLFSLGTSPFLTGLRLPGCTPGHIPLGGVLHRPLVVSTCPAMTALFCSQHLYFPLGNEPSKLLSPSGSRGVQSTP